MNTTRCDSEKKLGEDESFCTCPHCGKGYTKLSSFGKHIKEHKANNTINWEYEKRNG